MEVQMFSRLEHSLQTIAIATLVFGLCFFLPKMQYHLHIAKLPMVGGRNSEKQRNEFLKNGRKLYLQGYHKFKDSVFRMTTSDGDEEIVIPNRFLPELRKLPDSVLSFPEVIKELMYQKYTKFPDADPMVTHSVKADLTPGLSRLNPVVYAEVVRAVGEEMPECEDWTAVNIYSTLVRMVAKITGQVFVGPELCRNEDYQKIAVNYTLDVIEAQREIRELRPLFRPWTAPRLASVRKTHKAQREGEAFLGPVIQARRDAEKNDPNYRKPDDMLGWLMARQKEFGNKGAQDLVRSQLGLIFAGIHTTTMTATSILYTMAAHTEYIEPLREEVAQVMADNGGVITTRALQQMVKLDSFMKETIRFYPLGFTSFTRKVLRGFTLSNGQYIPAGSIIETASHATYSDPDNFPASGAEPVDVFDGMRHYKLRQGGSATDHARNQFVTTNEQNLFFGYGRHACPGRFFAANEIKMILARLLLDFDFQNEGGSKVRYADIIAGKSSIVDASKNLLFKRASV